MPTNSNCGGDPKNGRVGIKKLDAPEEAHREKHRFKIEIGRVANAKKIIQGLSLFQCSGRIHPILAPAQDKQLGVWLGQLGHDEIECPQRLWRQAHRLL